MDECRCQTIRLRVHEGYGHSSRHGHSPLWIRDHRTDAGCLPRSVQPDQRSPPAPDAKGSTSGPPPPAQQEEESPQAPTKTGNSRTDPSTILPRKRWSDCAHPNSMEGNSLRSHCPLAPETPEDGPLREEECSPIRDRRTPASQARGTRLASSRPRPQTQKTNGIFLWDSRRKGPPLLSLFSPDLPSGSHTPVDQTSTNYRNFILTLCLALQLPLSPTPGCRWPKVSTSR